MTHTRARMNRDPWQAEEFLQRKREMQAAGTDPEKIQQLQVRAPRTNVSFRGALQHSILELRRAASEMSMEPSPLRTVRIPQEGVKLAKLADGPTAHFE